jgi:uncharacterized membrane protein
MKRIKGIDTIRGLVIVITLLHMIEWWVLPEDDWLFDIMVGIVGEVGASGFLFVAGLSGIMLFRNRLNKAVNSDDYSVNQVKNEYLFRALIILIISLIFNSIVAIGTLNPLDIWKCFIPLTIGISLFLAFPLLKTPKSLRIALAVILWIVHYNLVSFLSPFQGKANLFGVLFHFLYNSLDLHPFLYYFSFFLIGTVVGDVILDIYLKDDQKERRMDLKKKFLIPSLIVGPILLLIGVLFQFPSFLIHITFSSTVYSLGFLLTLMAILLINEEFEIIKAKKSYRFFFFYSYYSLTVFFSHYLLYFIFLGQLNAFIIWIPIIATYILLTLLIRAVYKKYGVKASLKAQIGRLSQVLARRVKVKKEKKLNQI